MGRKIMKLTAIHSPFTTFCEGPEDIEGGYKLYFLFHAKNYFHRMPKDKDAEILVVSSGVGYFQYTLREWEYRHVMGIDSDQIKVEYAKSKGFNSECSNCFDFLEQAENKYDFIFAEQEVNHLTRDEFKLFLKLCHNALKPNGRLIINAANCANPLIATEYLGNNIDHYISITENNLKQYFLLIPFKEVEVFPHDFYVLKNNPLNYVARAVVKIIHTLLEIVFKMYGKHNAIFTKRLGVVAIK
jgi:2-polyprenyl-3-methyl-5-hydroxy-6-metoxy-1,4-benzoquinol methylase